MAALAVIASVASGGAGATQVSALDVAIWHLPGLGWGRPAIFNGAVYSLTGNHEVVALTKNEGRRLWRSVTQSSDLPVAGSRVLAARGTVVAGDYDLFAFDSESGAPKWTYSPSEGYGPGYYLGDVLGDTVYAGSPAGLMYAVSLTDGTERWRHSIKEKEPVTVFAPQVAGDLVLASYTVFASPPRGGVAAFRSTDGTLAWRFAFPGSQDASLSTGATCPVAVSGERVFAASNDGHVWALNAASGEPLWRAPPASVSADGFIDPRRDYRSVVVETGRLVVTSRTGFIVALAADTGAHLWSRHGTPNSTAVEITSGAGVVAIPYLSGMLRLLSSADGRELWAIPPGSGMSWPPVFDGDLMFMNGGAGLWAVPTRPR